MPFCIYTMVRVRLDAEPFFKKVNEVIFRMDQLSIEFLEM